MVTGFKVVFHLRKSLDYSRPEIPSTQNGSPVSQGWGVPRTEQMLQALVRSRGSRFPSQALLWSQLQFQNVAVCRSSVLGLFFCWDIRNTFVCQPPLRIWGCLTFRIPRPFGGVARPGAQQVTERPSQSLFHVLRMLLSSISKRFPF